MNLMLTNVEEIIKEVKVKCSLGYSQAMFEFVILRSTGLAKSGFRTLNFRKVCFRLSEKLLDEIP